MHRAGHRAGPAHHGQEPASGEGCACGQERRSGKDRRNELPQEQTPEPTISAAERTESLEKLMLSTTVRLEALARLLVEKGILSHEELADMLRAMQAEYLSQQLKKD